MSGKSSGWEGYLDAYKFGCLYPFVVTIILFILTQWCDSAIQDKIASFVFFMFVVGSGAAVYLRIVACKRYFILDVLPSLIKSLRYLRPAADEISEMVSYLRKTGHPAAPYLDAAKIWAMLQREE